MILITFIIFMIITVILILIDIFKKIEKIIFIIFCLLIFWITSICIIIFLEKVNILVLNLHESFISNFYVLGGLFIGIPLTIVYGLYIIIKLIFKRNTEKK